MRGWSAQCVGIVGAALGACSILSTVQAHECDNFILPLKAPLADLGDVLDAAHALAIEGACATLNARIEQALRWPSGPRRDQRLTYLRSPNTLVEEVYLAFADAEADVRHMECAAQSPSARQLHPGAVTATSTSGWMYDLAHFPLDPRRLILLWRSSSVKAHGVIFGTDKLSHFHHMGKLYYNTYASQRRRGRSFEDSARAAVEFWAMGLPLGEDILLGFVPTGVFSNADLAANYSGMLFFANLSEPIRLNGEVRPPMALLYDGLWRVNKHVRPESGFFASFLSDHWNEALNPNLYDVTFRFRMRSLLRERCGRVVAYYSGVEGRPRTPEYFDALATDLATYHGQPYGHWGGPDELITIGDLMRWNADSQEVAAHR